MPRSPPAAGTAARRRAAPAPPSRQCGRAAAAAALTWRPAGTPQRAQSLPGTEQAVVDAHPGQTRGVGAPPPPAR